ncbi:unnamed protein product [Durusdinium trenchii]|uniref:Phytanoyl-CoA dioxygenase n=1 Tax=Durusdinium trenchii TaxID=1381693 RepID=A0ABP0P2F2_9DINO
MAEAEVVERFPATVQVVGAPEPVINQHYKRVTLAQLRQHKKVKQQMANGLDVAYMGERPDQKRRWPYIWFQHDQIKIAMMGDNSSRYFANLHPFGFGPTQQWVDAENQFLTELRVLPAKGSDTDSSEACELELEPEKEANCPQLEEVHRAELREQGFTVVGPTAAFRCAVLDALRLANMLLGAAVNWSLGNFSAPWADKLLASNSEGCHNLRVRLNDEASAPFAKVLSFILPLAEELMQEPVEVPNCCQLASLPPDGAPTSDWTSQGDQTTTYHVDGRGQLKNNIALIVGVALTPPERSSSSWGAFVCHPGSHRNARLHQQYTDQYEGRVEPMDLGSPHMVPLGQADLLVAHPLLAHRRSQNWTGGESCFSVAAPLCFGALAVWGDPWSHVFAWPSWRMNVAFLSCTTVGGRHQSQSVGRVSASPKQGALKASDCSSRSKNNIQRSCSWRHWVYYRPMLVGQPKATTTRGLDRTPLVTGRIQVS